MSKPSDLGSLKIGSYILLPHSDQPSGEPCRIVEYDTSKPGKHGAAKARIVGEGIFDGQKRPHVGPVSMQIHVPMINKKVGQIISMTGDNVQLMDSETFETIPIRSKDGLYPIKSWIFSIEGIRRCISSNPSSYASS